MNLNQMKKLGVLGAAAFALAFAPMAASAQVDKCSKDLTKNAAKAMTDVQKEIAKCVDGWLKTEVKGSGHIKQAEKCQGSFDKIGMGADISSDTKTKLGKAFDKLTGAFPGGAKAKCTDGDLRDLGVFTTADFPGVGARLSVMAAFARAWSAQNAINGDTSRALSEAADGRCDLAEQVGCDTSSDCDDAAVSAGGNPGDFGTCASTSCPECADFSAPANGVATNTNASGPCWTTQCRGPGTNETQTFLSAMAPPVTTQLTLFGANPTEHCNVPEILPNAIGVVGGPAKGQKADLENPPGTPVLGVCLDGTRGVGYLALASDALLPDVDAVLCADVDTTGDDDCAAFSNCTVQAGAPNSKSCQDLTVTTPGSAGGAVFANQIRIHASTSTASGGDPCTTGLFLGGVGAPGANITSTGTHSGTLNDAGPGTASGSFDLVVAPVTGSLFDTVAAQGGTLIGGLAGTTAIIATDPGTAAIIGHSMTKIQTSCVKP